MNNQNSELMHGEGTIVYITRASDRAVNQANIDSVSNHATVALYHLRFISITKVVQMGEKNLMNSKVKA